MKKPIHQIHDFDELWEQMRTLPEPPLRQGMEARFWQRFDEEFAEEEQRRQRQKHHTWWRRLWRSPYPVSLAMAACLYAFFWAFQVHQATISPAQEAPRAATRSVTPPSPLQAKGTTHTAQAQDAESMEMLRRLPMWKQLELFENFEAIQQLSKGEGT